MRKLFKVLTILVCIVGIFIGVLYICEGFHDFKSVRDLFRPVEEHGVVLGDQAKTIKLGVILLTVCGLVLVVGSVLGTVGIFKNSIVIALISVAAFATTGAFMAHYGDILKGMKDLKLGGNVCFIMAAVIAVFFGVTYLLNKKKEKQ